MSVCLYCVFQQQCERRQLLHYITATIRTEFTVGPHCWNNVNRDHYSITMLLTMTSYTIVAFGIVVAFVIPSFSADVAARNVP